MHNTTHNNNEHKPFYCHYSGQPALAGTSPLSFLQAGCPSWHPTNSVKALKAITIHIFKVIAKSGTTTSFVCTGSGIGSSSDIKMRPLRNVYGAVMVYVRTCLAIRDHRL